MPRRPPPRDTPVVPADDHVSETDTDDDDLDENTPINDENAFPAHASSSLFVLRTPLPHSRSSEDTALRDITDQFFHPPSPSPVRIAKRKQHTPHTIEPPRRPKKPKSLAYPADPPNWLYSRSSSSLPPSSPFPPSTTNVDHARPTDHSVDHPTTARYEYDLGTPSKASDPDPFGFVAVERAVKSKRPASPLVLPKPPSRISPVKSPPLSTVFAPAPDPAVSVFASFSQLDVPVATNNEDIDELYADEPVAGPSHPVHVPVAPLLMLNSDQPLIQTGATQSQPTFPDPLRTPRKRKRHASPTPTNPDEEESDVPSSPSPVKVSVGASTQTHRRSAAARTSRTPVPKATRSQTKAAGTAKASTVSASQKRRITSSRQNIPTPSTTHRSPSSRPSTTPSTPVAPRRSTRQAAVGARTKLKGTTSDGENEVQPTRMTLRSRIAKANVKAKTVTSDGRGKQPLPKAKVAATATATKPARARSKRKTNTKGTKGKGKARPLENAQDLSDGTLERYEKERRERLAYFKRLEGYQIHKENVYVV